MFILQNLEDPYFFVQVCGAERHIYPSYKVSTLQCLKIFNFALKLAKNRLRSNSILELFIKVQFGQVLATINDFLLNRMDW